MAVSPGQFFPTTPSLSIATWPPLTIPFTSPTYCTNRWIILTSGDTTIANGPASRNCLPDGEYTHSPGTVLSDYHIVNVAEYRTPGWTTGGLRAWGAACCKSGYTNTETIESLFRCFSFFISPITALDPWAGDGREQKTTTTILSWGTIVDDNMVVYWMDSDLSKFDSGYAATLQERFTIGFTSTATMGITRDTATALVRTQLTSVTSSSSSSSVAPNSPETAEDSISGLDARAKAGIGLGVAILAILMGIAGFLLYRKQVQKQRAVDQAFTKQNEQPEFVQPQRA
ncbi:hypothetical protein BKA58DRAFT_450813 [Alternaria rosae]|uniref:uncharacterized protein n=1 Tax=Alternaria rosae TaxID=1187941 RepID=UPI001E8E9D3E|nr:uncharacterized protein BKA58DRAFT_450813 [Alternaria rosae]KAH6848441.1 hypothetical protein BKA58DRAFT_450813 [Alternaria rosae]